MRLHRLTVRDLKGVTETTVTFPETGVVVIAGPNEVGKSTLLEAFDLLLDGRAKATSRAERVRSLQPVGRDVAPFVEAELTLGRHRLVFAKQWLRSPATTLRVLAPQPLQLSGEAAQEWLDELLADALDRPLWQALRLAQSTDAAGSQVPLAASDALTRALDAAAGARLHSGEGTELLAVVEQEFRTFFTPTGRATGAYKTAVAAVTDAEQGVMEAHARAQEADALLDAQEEQRAELARRQSARAPLTEAHEAASGAADEVDRLIAEQERAAASLTQARELSLQATRRRDERVRVAAELDELATALTEGQARLTDDREALAALGDAEQSAWQAQADAEQAVEAASAEAERAGAAVRSAAQRRELARARRRVDALDVLAGQVARVQQARGALLEVAPDQLEGLLAIEQEVRVLGAEREAHATAVQVQPLSDGEGPAVVVDGQPLPSAEVWRGSVTDPLQVEVPGVLRVTMTPASAGAERAASVTEAEARLGAALGECGVRSVADARAAARATAELRAERQRLADRRCTLLDGETEEHLREQLAELGNALPEPDGAVDVGVTDLAVLRARHDEALAAVHQAQVGRVAATGRAQQAAGARQQAEQRLATRVGALEADTGRFERDQQRLAQLRAEHDDDALGAEVRARATDYARVEAVAGHARRAVRAIDVEAVRARHLEAQERLLEHEDAVADLAAQLQRLGGQIELAASEGRAEAHLEALAVLDATRLELSRLERRARAARQLHRTLQRHRDDAHRAYVRPYTQALEQLGEQVYGASFGVEVDADLTVRSRTLHGTTVPFAQLSGGAKEQLGILARLAVAGLVDPDQGVPVVVDDALGYTDPDRLARVGDVLGAPGDHAQVILLTCTPARYADIPSATTIRLTA